MNKFLRSSLFQAFVYLVLVYLAGVMGFKIIYNYTWIDAIYMTVITITTVGFGEVHPLSTSEKIYTSVLIICSIFIVGYAIKVASEYILSTNRIGNLRLRKVQKQIDLLNNHIIVCGFGRNGQQAAQKLAAYNRPFVIVEMDEEVIDKMDDDLLFVHGNADEDETLLKAGIERASTIICALPSDADNLFVVLSARQINEDIKIISRASQETSYKKLKLAGANNVIMPDRIGGDHMASLVVVPDLVEFLDNLTVSGEQDSINVEQIAFEKVCPDGAEKAIKELDLRKKTGCSIIGYKTSDGEYVVNPEPSTLVQQNSKLIVIGRPNQIDNLKELYDV
ncbi:MAG: potassium channel protein [Bacteroidia bacterium]|nr:potassium channel protein [Bacteroidia bacterium]NNM22528.1 potassium channel protein [Flavobacteriaceae bacterium]